MAKSSAHPSLFARIAKPLLLCATTGLVAWLAALGGLAPTHASAIAVGAFIFVVGTILVASEYRIPAAFGALAVLVATHSMSLESVLGHTQLDIIFFLCGMMVLVGVLKDLGFMSWIIQSIISRKNMTGVSFTIILCVLSALLASILDEVSSIVVILALVFQVCDTLKLRPTPFVLIGVLCTNIGSPTTMLGNPVGIFIGTKAGFTFTQFLHGASPITVVSILATIGVLLLWFRKDIHEMTERMEEHRRENKGLGPLVKIPYKTGLFILIATVTAIAFHHQIEGWLGLLGTPGNHNAFLIVTPLIAAGLLMAWRPHRAGHYIREDVEWETLLFFMLLFAISGGLEVTGVTENMALKLRALTASGLSMHMLSALVVGISSIGSAFVDNMTFVAAFSPVIKEMVSFDSSYNTLWWALLFGACYGGNITVIGSTANIVALGLLERHSHLRISFLEWFKVGLAVGAVTCVIGWAAICIEPPPHPVVATAPAAAEQSPDLPPSASPADSLPAAP